MICPRKGKGPGKSNRGFGKEGKGKRSGISSLCRIPPKRPNNTRERERPGGLPASRCKGKSRTTLLSPQCPPPLEDHPLMMPQRRYQEDPQPCPQQPQENHLPPRYTPYDMEGLPCYNDLYPPGQTIFCFVDTQIPFQILPSPSLFP